MLYAAQGGKWFQNKYLAGKFLNTLSKSHSNALMCVKLIKNERLENSYSILKMVNNLKNSHKILYNLQFSIVIIIMIYLVSKLIQWLHLHSISENSSNHNLNLFSTIGTRTKFFIAIYFCCCCLAFVFSCP